MLDLLRYQMSDVPCLTAWPMLQGKFFADALFEAGIPYRLWSRSQVAHGEAPMSHAESDRRLLAYRDLGDHSIAAVVIESPYDDAAAHDIMSDLNDDYDFARLYQSFHGLACSVDEVSERLRTPPTARQAAMLDAMKVELDAVSVTDARP